MMHPIHEIFEARIRSSGCLLKLSHDAGAANWLALHSSRVAVVIILAVVASSVPAFGSFISFVGSTVCVLLAFVFPSAFHLSIVGSSMSMWRRLLDYGFLLFGLVFAGYGMFTAL
jgi:proton-coupled amino acid transporter